MHLEFDGTGPLHGQLTRALKDAICARRLAPGARLPATRELARDLRLSRNTVLAAYEQLGAEGFIEGRVGSGSYVAEIEARQPVPPPARSRKPRLAPFARSALEQRANLPPGHRRKPVRYNLEYGLPLVTPALQSLWRRALGRAADDTVLDYPPAEGIPELRTAIAGYLARRRGLVADPEDIVIVSGVQQGMDLCVRALVEPGQLTAIEEPHYQGTRQALLAHGAALVPVPIDRDGLDVAALPTQGARLVCVTPSHQFPSGVLMSLPRRMALLEWATRHDAWIVEDDYDGEFRYDVRPIAALKSLDRGERVIYVGSFSKVMFPALRLGYIVVPPSLRDALRASKWLCDRGCPAIEQHALALLIGDGRFERMLRRSGRALTERRSALLRGLTRHCDGLVEVEGTSAGMHVTAWLPKHARNAVDAVVAAGEARELGLYPIAPYYMTRAPRAGLLLGYSAITPRDLGEATRRLGEVLRATL